ncbi:hypothetical protein GCM10023170_075700 [Phytohabitans houttuyneae]
MVETRVVVERGDELGERYRRPSPRSLAHNADRWSLAARLDVRSSARQLAYRREHGTEALEQRFDEVGIDPTDASRGSVV